MKLSRRSPKTVTVAMNPLVDVDMGGNNVLSMYLLFESRISVRMAGRRKQ